MSIFSKRQYEELADIMAEAYDDAYNPKDGREDEGLVQGIDLVRERLIRNLRFNNANFKEQVFIKAMDRRRGE